MKKFPTYILNLDHEKERWKQVSKNIAERITFAKNITRWSASERKPEEFNPKMEDMGEYTKKLRSVCLAHTWSIIDILHDAQKKGYKEILFVEDDCYFYDKTETIDNVDPNEVVQDVWNKIKNDPRWDMIALGYFNIGAYAKIKDIKNVVATQSRKINYSSKRNSETFMGMHAMIFRVDRTLKYAYFNTQIEGALDVTIGALARCDKDNIPLLVMVPMLARQRNIMSGIAEDDKGDKIHCYHSAITRKLDASMYTNVMGIRNKMTHNLHNNCIRIFDWSLPFSEIPDPYDKKEWCVCEFCSTFDWAKKAILDYQKDVKDFDLST